MADGSCSGSSNPLQNLQKHASTDNSLEQDRLTSRLPQTGEGFRSRPSANGGNVNAEFEAFQNGTPQPVSPPNVHPPWNSTPNQLHPNGVASGVDWRWSPGQSVESIAERTEPDQWNPYMLPVNERPAPVPPNAPRMSYVKLAGRPQDPVDFGRENPPLRRWRSGSNWAQDFAYLAVESSGIGNTAGRPKAPPGPSNATIDFPPHSDPNPSMIYKSPPPKAGLIRASRNSHRPGRGAPATEHQSPAFEDQQEPTIHQPRAFRPINFNHGQQSPLGAPNRRLFQPPSFGEQEAREDRMRQFVAEQQEQQRAFELEFDRFASEPNTLQNEDKAENFQSKEKVAKPEQKTEVANPQVAKTAEKTSSQNGHKFEDPLTADILQPKAETSLKKQSTGDELAKTAGELVETVSPNTSKKFEESNFMAFMRELRDENVRLEDDKFVDVGGKPLEDPDVDVKDKATDIGNVRVQKEPLTGLGVDKKEVHDVHPGGAAYPQGRSDSDPPFNRNRRYDPEQFGGHPVNDF
ncbi:MAG: hypothetical protein M1831_003014 [Alyxoria varia]|nr:MAG: hypothetical protein M1831_003014 [Alyxoria varia]